MTDRTVQVRLRANPNQYIAAMKAAGAATRDLHNEIDKTNDRTAWLAQSILALTPAATTLGAAAVPVFSGLATQMTVAVGAAGVMALGFNGIGDSLKALNDYQLDPTEANLEKLNTAMSKVGEEGAEFVVFLDSLGPKFSELSNTSREGMFPGITRGITDFMDLMPELDRVVDQVSKGIGQLARDAGAGLSGEGFSDFFDYLENEARPILVQFGRTIGNFAEGIANMIVAFGPLSSSFSKGMLEMSRSFVDWSDSLAGSTGFQEFVDYVQSAGPKALDFLSSLTMALVEIVEAAAPIGGPMLYALTKVLDVIGAIADTPLGPIVLGVVALTSAWGRLNAVAAITGGGVMAKATAGMRLNLATAKMLTPSIGELNTAFWKMGESVKRQSTETRLAMTQTKAFGKAVAPVAGQMALLAVATTGVADGMELSNTATGALIGSIGGKYGVAVGAAIGAAKDFAATNDGLTKSLEGTRDALDAAFATKPGSANVDAAAAQYQAAFDAREEIRRKIEDNPMSGGKAIFEDIFGDNDYEEAYPELKRLFDDLQRLREREAEASRKRAADQAYYNSIQAETAALEDNIQAMRDKRAEALTGMNAELDYQEAVLDASAAAKEYNDVLKGNGQLTPGLKREGIAAKRELDNLAAAWNGLSDEAQNIPGRYQKAIDKFVETAVAMGMTEEAARRMAREFLNIPPIKIEVDDSEADRKIKAFKRHLASIDRFIPVDIHVSRTGGDLPFLSGGIPQADGGTIPGPRYPYADKVHIFAAPGEEVVSNRHGGADANRAELKAASRGAKLAVVGYADGGTIGRSVQVGRDTSRVYAMAGPGGGIDYDRLADAMAAMRPPQQLYGNVTVIDGYGGFKKQMTEDQQRAGHGGYGND